MSQLPPSQLPPNQSDATISQSDVKPLTLRDAAVVEASAPSFYSAKRLAAAWSVTVQTVTSYVKLGMPVAAFNPNRLFDREACQAWRDLNKPARGHGGTRARAGRKLASVPENAAQDPMTKLGSVGESITKAKDDTGAILAMLSMSPSELLQLVGNEEEIAKRLSPTGTKRFLDLVRGAFERHKLDLLVGTVVEKDKVRSAFGQHMRAVRANLDGMPALAEARVRDLLGLTHEQAALVRAEIAAIVRSVQRAIAADPLGETTLDLKLAEAV